MADTNIIVTYESKETTHIVSMVITNNKKNWHHHDLWSIGTDMLTPIIIWQNDIIQYNQSYVYVLVSDTETCLTLGYTQSEECLCDCAS
jgi:hypothetical protein